MSQPGKTSKPKSRADVSFLSWLGEQAWTSALICLLLAGITAGVYSHALSNQFVNYDDNDYVTLNRHVQTGLTGANVAWAFTTGHASNWHPLTWLSHMLDCQWFGENNALAHHRTSVVFHVLNTVLLFLVLRAMTGTLWRCAFVAALFGLHPLHVESVAWISERKDLLSTFFFLLTVGAYLVYVSSCPRSVSILNEPATGRGKEQKVISSSNRTREAAKREKGSRATRADMRETTPQVASLSVNPARAGVAYVMALLFFALGLMSKPMLVTMPFVLLLLDFWPLKRLSLPQWRESRESLARLVWEKAPFFLLTIASSVITFLVQRKGGAISTSVSLGQRIANALVSYERYIAKMIWPAKLSVLYPYPDQGNWPLARVFAATTLVLGLSILAASQTRRRPYVLFGWLWFLGMLVPVIGLVQVGIQSMADRYTYIPLIGLFIAITWGICDFVLEWEGRAQFLIVTGLLSLGACATLTWHQVGFWRSSLSLFEHAVDVTENNYLAYNNIGYFLSSEGKTAEAMENYQKSLTINSNYSDALNNVGYALAGQKKFAEAIPYYERALTSQPNQAEVHNNLGNAFSDLGRTQEAMMQYQIALRLDPEHAGAHNNVGIALAKEGKLDEAIAHLRSAIQFKPKYASAHGHLGNVLAMQDKLDEAIREYQECLQLDPKDAQAYNNLGTALARHGKLQEAVPNYEHALQLNTNNPEAYSSLAFVLSSLGKQPEAHYNMALGFALQGKRDEAVAHLKEALRLKPDYPEAQRQLEILSAPR